MTKIKKQKINKYTDRDFFTKLILFLVIKIKDFIHDLKNPRGFTEFGLTMYCGRQGAGKTIAMTEYLERMRIKYPNALIITNYGYTHESRAMQDWHDFFTIKNGTDGVIFAIDEVQNEFSSAAWNKFPETLLSEITQQRKQRVKIVATSQIYTRVVKQLREQCTDVVDCRTLFGRWTFATCYDAVDYNATIDSPSSKQKLIKRYSNSFVQDSYIRSCYDTFAKIERLEKMEFLTKKERGA